MPIVLNPADCAVLLYNPVLHIVKIIDTVCDLNLNALLHLVEILRVHHTLKGVSRKRAKLLLCLTAKNPQHSAVGVQQFLRLICAVHKQPSRHTLQYRFNFRQCMFFKSHHFLIHDESSAFITFISFNLPLFFLLYNIFDSKKTIKYKKSLIIYQRFNLSEIFCA